MKKVYISRSETIIPLRYLEEMEKRAQLEAAYRLAVVQMTGYMAGVRRELDAVKGRTDVESRVYAARLRGRIDAVAQFDKAVVEAAMDV